MILDRPVPDGAAAVCGVVLLRSDGAALLQLRDDRPDIQDPGIWVFPGGHVERGETLKSGAEREFLEETGYRCRDLEELVRYSAEEIGYPGRYAVAFFWSRFDGKQEIWCYEGQDLRFIERLEAGSLPKRDYLLKVWDRALAASGIQPTPAGQAGEK
ncbi:MAG: NUDIX hydrolase [Acidobacteria bacterium]|nr:NUDIX hydrolase [Acidobacteriota bacterium]